MIASLYFFGASKMFLICEYLKILAVLKNTTKPKTPHLSTQEHPAPQPWLPSDQTPHPSITALY